MSAIYHDDEWKHADEQPAPLRLVRRTRAQMQEHFDLGYAMGRLTLAQWRLSTDITGTLDELGRPRLMTPNEWANQTLAMPINSEA